MEVTDLVGIRQKVGSAAVVDLWAAVVIIDRAAWRKMWVSQVTGAMPESIRSANGLPAPTGGSWSACRRPGR